MNDTKWCEWYPDYELIGTLISYYRSPYFDRELEMQQKTRDIIAYLKPRLQDWLQEIDFAEQELSELK